MKKPPALEGLLEELRDEGIQSDVETAKTSKAVVRLGDDDDEAFTLSAAECRLIFATTDTAARFAESIDAVEEVSIELTDLGVDGPVLERLERSFLTVDEI